MRPFERNMSPMEKEMLNHQLHLKEMRELDDFKKCITNIVENYIKMIDTKISTQDLEIQKATLYMVDNISKTASEFLTNLFEKGKITLDLTYDPNTESLYIGGELIE